MVKIGCISNQMAQKLLELEFCNQETLRLKMKGGRSLGVLAVFKKQGIRIQTQNCRVLFSLLYRGVIIAFVIKSYYETQIV